MVVPFAQNVDLSIRAARRTLRCGYELETKETADALRFYSRTFRWNRDCFKVRDRAGSCMLAIGILEHEMLFDGRALSHRPQVCSDGWCHCRCHSWHVYRVGDRTWS